MTRAFIDKSPVGSGQSGLVARSGFCSECGARPDNQDYGGALIRNGADSIIIAAIADGVGGAAGGRVAAETAVRGFIEGCVGLIAQKSPKEAALLSLESINRWIHAMGRRDPAAAGMACTFTGLVCRGRLGHLVHVGDSRLYRLRGDRLELLTADHIVGPGATHMLTRAIGAEADVVIDFLLLQNEPHDRYLFCTDGVHGATSDGVLREVLAKRAAPQQAAQELVELAIASHLGDNATALVVDILELPDADYSEIEGALGSRLILPLPTIGAVIDNFRLDSVLSDGRYTRVFKATDDIAGRQVVLKFPKPLAGADRAILEAFTRETWIAGRVESPFVGEVLQLGDRQSRLYLALPFYEGETLESRLQREPRFTLTAGIDIALKLAKGLAAVHRAGVIHRDIKPDNIMVQPPSAAGISVKLIDFGVARLTPPRTEADAPEPGTASYMAPELFDGRPADEKSDQFALGVTIYRLFTRQYPYGEIEPFSHPRFGRPTPLFSSRPDLPAWLERTVGRAIAVDPEDRYADVLEFMFELEHGADRASPVDVRRKPLYQQNPLLFWKVVAAMLTLVLISVLFFLAQATPH